MDRLYDFTVSGIDGNGQQYMSGMLEPEWLDNRGLRNGRAFSIELDHQKQISTIMNFQWISGAPRNFEVIAKLKGEIVDVVEVPGLLEKYKILGVITNET